MESEDGVPVWSIVENRVGDNWTRPEWATDDHLYLMVQFVETWLLTDPDALARYYGAGFRTKVLPQTNLEQRTKDTRKGPYTHGTAHLIIGTVDPAKVRTLTHGERLFASLATLITQHPAK